MIFNNALEEGLNSDKHSNPHNNHSHNNNNSTNKLSHSSSTGQLSTSTVFNCFQDDKPQIKIAEIKLGYNSLQQIRDLQLRTLKQEK